MKNKTLLFILFASVAFIVGSKRSKKWVTPNIGKQFDPLFKEAEKRYNLPSGILSRLALQESNYNPNAKGSADELGLMQFREATAKDMGIQNRADPKQSIFGAGKYLDWLKKRPGVNSWKDVLAAYNWGIGNIQRKGYSEAPLSTKNYAESILKDIGLT